MEIKYERTLLF